MRRVGTNESGTVCDRFDVESISGVGSTISNSYATGSVTGSSDVGGLVGLNSATITASYYNTETTGQSDTGKGEGKTTADLLTPTGYMGIYETWSDGPDGTAGNDDDTDYWDFGTDMQYPVLKIDVNGDGTAGGDDDLALQRPPRLNVNPTRLDFTAMGEGMEFAIISNVDWTVNSDRGWLMLDSDSGNANMIITATAQENSGAERTATITITSETLTQTVTVTQAHSDDSELINITNLAQLNAIRYDLDGDGVADDVSDETAYDDAAFLGLAVGTYSGYELMVNLDFDAASSYASGTINMDWTTGSGWEPIGDNSTSSNDSRFTAIFEGNGHTIFNLFINRSSTGYVGLFGYGGSTAGLHNLGMVNVEVTGDENVGGLVGSNAGDISGSYATGAVTGAVTGSGDSVGGLVGASESGGTVSNSYATGVVTGSNFTGGLVGNNAGDISGSYATGSVKGNNYVGGLVGDINGGTVSGSYATGLVTGNGDLGGLVGRDNSSMITESYYNSETTGQSDNTGKGEPKTTAQLQTPTGYTDTGIYATWDDGSDGTAGNDDDTDYWDFGTNEQYPVLKLDVNGDGTVGDDTDLYLQRLRLIVTPSSLDFEEVNTVSTATNEMTYNLTGENLNMEVTLAIEGAPTGIFTINTTSPITPVNGVVDQMITVTFDPVAAQAYTATISHNGGGLVPAVVNLMGNAVSPSLTFTAANPLPEDPTGTFDFGRVNIASSVTFTYMLTGINLTNQQVTLTSSDPVAFAISVTTPLTPEIDGTLSQEITVTFDPDSEQPYTGMITHSGGGLASDFILNFKGEGVDPTLMFPSTISGNTHDFGQVNTATPTSTTFTYTLTGENLTSQQVTLTSSDPAAFAISVTDPLTPESDGSLSQEITITFTPTNGVTDTGTITHSGGGLMSDLVLNLTGSGISPSLTLTVDGSLPDGITENPVGTFDFGNVNTTSTRSINFTVTGENLIETDGTITDGTMLSIVTTGMLSLGTSEPLQISLTNPPPIINSGGITLNFVATFDPSTTGDSEGIITFGSTTAGVAPIVLTLKGRGVVPTLQATPNSLNFGDVNTGSSASIITYNLTGANLTTEVVTLELGGTNASLFTISRTVPITPVNGVINETITVTFDPDDALSYNAMITHSGGGLTTSLVVPLIGAGTLEATPTLTSTEPNLDFGQVNTASTSSMMTYDLTGANLTGEVTLAIEGTDEGLFSLDITTPLSISGGAISGKTVTVTFSPTDSGGPFTAMITHNGGGLAPVVVPLMGSAVSPSLEATPNSLDFMQVNTASTTTNEMTYDLTGANLTGDVTLELGGAGSGAFTIDPTGPLTLEDGVSETITITFAPTDAQTYNAMITHTGGGLTTPVVVPLTGSAVSPSLTFAAQDPPPEGITITQDSPPGTGTTFDFGDVNTGSMRSISFTVTGENLIETDGTQLSILSDMVVSLDGTTPLQVNFRNPPPFINSGGINLTFDAIFAPTTTDPLEGTITFGSTTAGVAPIVLTLKGTGVVPSLTSNKNDLDFGDVNTASTSSMMTYNLTGANLTMDVVTLELGGTNANLFTISPTDPITPVNGTVDKIITVTFDPAVAGDSFTAMITHTGGGLTTPVVVNLRGNAVSPSLEATPNSLDFMQVNTASTTTTMTYDLKGENLTGEVTLAIAPPGIFTIDPPDPLMLEGDGSLILTPVGGEVNATITITFAPTDAQTYNAMITHSGGGLAPIVVPLTGSAVSPFLEATPSSLDFMQVNTASPGTMTYNLTGANLTGQVDLVISGTNADLFSLDITTISPSEAISGTDVTVTFNPDVAGDPFTAMITHSGGGLAPVVVPLTGSAVSPFLTSNKNDLNFGDVNTGSSASIITYNLTGANLTTDVTLAIEGAPTGIFTIDPPDPLMLEGDGSLSQEIRVTFNPTATQMYTATITHSSGGLTSVIVDLAGTGTLAPTPTLQADPNSLDFGDLNTSSPASIITYDLTGANLTGDVTLELGGAGSGAFTISPTDPITQSSGVVSQEITVTFNPTAAQTYTAMITHSGGGLAPVVVNLAGTGTLAPTPTLQADPNSLDFGDLNTSSPASIITYDLTGANLTGDVTLELGGAGSGAFTISPTVPITQSSGAVNQEITVTFNPTAAQTYTAMITHSGGGLAPVVVNLAGTGTLAPTPTLTSTEPNLNFGQVNTASPASIITYDLTGANLTGEVTLAIEGAPTGIFTIDPPDPLTPVGGVVNATITVTFDPVAAQTYNAMITHSGGGLAPVVVNLAGTGILAPTTDDATLINITTLAQLNAIRYDLDGNGMADDVSDEAAYQTAFSGLATGTYKGYELMNDLDFKNSSTNTDDFSIWAEGSTASGKIDPGWDPIGDYTSEIVNSPFSATFEGNGHTISNLYINRESTSNVGLFSYVSGDSAELRNIGLLEVKVTGYDYVGSLVGDNRVDISNSYATGSVTGNDSVGGLVGFSFKSTVSNSYATGSVTGEGTVGGLVGHNAVNTVSNSYATGAVTGEGTVGGLVGTNDGDISGSYATGTVTGEGIVGGLVGYNEGNTVSSYATGSVTGTGFSVGGLVGVNQGNISVISVSYATGSVTGYEDVGGLVGYNEDGTVSNSYATGSVMGNGYLGGLVGSNDAGMITASYYNSETTGQSDTGKGDLKITAELQTPTGYTDTGIYATWNDGPDGMASSPDDTDYWDFGTDEQYPVLKIDVDRNGTVDNTDFRLQRLRLIVTPSSLNFEEVNIVSTPSMMTYNLTGENLTEDVTLAIEGAPIGIFTINTTSPITPIDGAVDQMITVTFDPAAAQAYTATISHNGGGLVPVVVNLMGNAVSPSLTSNKNDLNFGDVNTGSSASIITYNLTGENLTTDVTLAIAGAPTGIFTIDPTVLTLESDGSLSQEITVTFNPADALPYNAMITHSGGGLTSELLVPLTGAGTLAPTPTLQATPNSLDFRDVNTASTTTNEMTYNLTGANLTGQVDLVISGTNADLFSLDITTISPSEAISGTDVTVTFNPDVAGGPFTAMITHNGGGLAPVVVSLTGSAVSPSLTFAVQNPLPVGITQDPTGTFDFGNVNTGSMPSISFTVTGENLIETDGQLSIHTTEMVSLDISYPLHIRLTSPPLINSGGVTLTFDATFKPSTTGLSEGTIILGRTTTGVAPIVLTLKGTGVVPSLTFAAQDPLPVGITESPTGTFDFGQVNTATTPPTFTYMLTGINLTDEQVTLASSDDAFIISVTTPLTPETDGTLSQEITVTFDPVIEQPYTGMITHSGGGLASNFILNFKGEGVEPTLMFSPTISGNTHDFGQVNTATTPPTFTYMLTGINLTDEQVTLTSSDPALFAISSTSLMPEPNGILSQEITVTFDPVIEQPYTGMITHSGGGLVDVDNLILNLEGSGISPTLTFVAKTPLPDGITEDPSGTFDFGSVNTGLTHSIIFTVTGENLTENVTLGIGGTDPEGFTISPTDLSQSGGILNTEVTVTFRPTAIQVYVGSITHSGGGLLNGLLANLIGRGTRPPKDVDIDDNGLIEIYNIEELNNIRYNLAGTSVTTEASTTNDTGCPMGGCNGYELMQNLDFSDPNSYASGMVNNDFRPSGADPATATNAGFPPIEGGFTGIFEGNGFQIHNLYVNISGDAGLFADLGAGTIRNLGIVNAYITSTTQSAGGLVGQQTGLSSQVTNCYATGTVTGNIHAGGLVGSQTGNMSEVINCYATANVEGSDNAGGLVGSQSGSSSQITNCYATGTVTGATNIGGLVGTLGTSASITASYWNATTSAITNGVGSGTNLGVTSRTTTEMYALTATSTGWNSHDWNFGSTSQYPALRSYKTNDSDMQIEGDIICAQPTPRVQCTPTWRLTDTSGSTINSLSLDFGDVSIAADPPTLTYILIGENLTEDVVLMSAGSGFTISSTGTLMPIDGILNTAITVTFRPTAIQGYSGSITHSGGGLGDLILNLSGTAISPTDVDLDDDGLIEIYNIEGLNNIRYNLAGTSITTETSTTNDTGCPMGGCNGYELMQNLDFSDPNSYASGIANTDFLPDGADPATATNAGFPPIGGSFTGTFEGNGFQIHKLYVNISGDAGLFADLGTGTIRNLGIVDANVTGNNNVGGLVGLQSGLSSQITNCYATGTIKATTQNAGGLVGEQSGDLSQITNCYATANVTGNSNAGGLVGKQTGTISQITNCYATGTVAATGGIPKIGGLVGEKGALASITASYWDATTTASLGVGNDDSSTDSSTTTDMYALTATSTGWSSNDWNFGSTSQYPALRSYKTNDSDMQIEGDIICAQPLPRVQCSPTWRLTDTSGNTTDRLDFGDVSVAADPPTLTYILVGENLTEDVMLMSSGNGFTISINTLVSIDGKINQEVTVTFDPVAAQIYSGTITHSSSEFSSSLTLHGKGITAPTLMVETTLPDGITESPENTFNFDKVNIASSATFTYMLTGINLTDEQITLTSSNSVFIISPTVPLTPEPDGVLSQMITVTFDPVSGQTYTGTITHSGGGLVSDLILTLNGTGIDPTLMFPSTISGNTHDFGQVNTATTPPTTFTYMLTGENLTNQQITLTSSDPAFSISPIGLLTPEPDGSLSEEITITFTPTNGVTDTGTITHSGGGLMGDLVLNLTGSGISPSLTLTVDGSLPDGITENPVGTFDFGNVNTDLTRSINFTVTGENLIETDGTITDGTMLSIAKTGMLSLGTSEPLQISLTNPPPIINSGGITLNFVATFDPGTTGDSEGTITFGSTTAGVEPINLTLKGRGVVPTLQATPNSLNFGDVNTGSPASIITYNLTGADLTTDVTLELGGTNASLFTISRTVPITPAGDGSLIQEITVTFDPDDALPYTAMITHSGGGLTTPLVVSLRGAGTLAATPTLISTESNLDFGQVNTASTSSMMTYDLTGANLTGEVTLAIEGTDEGLFSLDITTPLSISGGAISGETVTVTFSPTDSGGPFTAMITHNGGGLAPVVVPLIGRAVSPSLTFAVDGSLPDGITQNPSGTFDFGNVNTSSTRSIRFTVTGENLIETDGTMLSTVLTGMLSLGTSEPLQVSITPPATTIMSGGITLSFVATFDPTTTDDSEGTITFRGPTSTTPEVVLTFKGRGVVPTLQATQNNLNFGQVNTASTTFTTRSYDLTGANLTEDVTLTIEGPNEGLFFANMTTISPLSGGAISGTTVTVIFDPTTAGNPFTATIIHNGGGLTTPVEVNLVGSAVSPTLISNTNSLDFGDVNTSSTPSMMTYNLTGANLAEDVTLVIEGTDSGSFTISPTGPIVAGSGAVNETITVTFDPTATKTYAAMITHSGGGLAPIVVNLTGTGTNVGLILQDDPTLINVANLEQLNAIRYDLDGNGVADDVSNVTAYQAAFSGLATDTYDGYELMVNLDFDVASNYASGRINMDWTTGSGWEPIGVQVNQFTAIFEGNGHTISNLFIDRSSTNYVGLFGYVSGDSSELRNLGMVEVEVTGDSYVGGLTGINYQGTVSGSYATGSVTGTSSQVGGLVGRNQAGTVSGSYATGSMTGVSDVGGLVGYNSGNTVSSYATGSVKGESYLGGLVGDNPGNTVSSYATGSVTGNYLVGGLVGNNSRGTVTASYYNTETTGQDDVGKGEPKTTADLLTPTGYTDIYEAWDDGLDGTADNDDDTDYWDFGTDEQYPVLKLDVNGNSIVGDVDDLQLQRPMLSVEHSNLDFGDVNTGSPASTMTYNLTGTNLAGEVTLTIGGAAPTGIFTISSTDPIAAVSGVVDQMITVTFDPVSEQLYTGTITHSGGGLAPVVVNLKGNAIGPSLTFAAVVPLPDGITENPSGTFDFGDVNIGGSSSTFTYTLVGETLTSDVILESSDAAFTTAVTKGTLKQSDGAANAKIIVAFKPTIEKNYTATITHSTDGLTNPIVLTLSGKGIVDTSIIPNLKPILIIEPNLPDGITQNPVNTFNFGEVDITATPTSFTYRLTGIDFTGQITMENSNPVFTTTVSEGSLSESGNVLNAVITVAFNPTAEKNYTGTITHSGGNLTDSHVITLNGTGIPKPILGVDDIISPLRLSPNPVTNLLNIQGHGVMQVMVYSITGKLHGSYQITDKGKVSFKTLPAGLYIVHIKSSIGITSHQVLKRADL